MIRDVSKNNVHNYSEMKQRDNMLIFMYYYLCNMSEIIGIVLSAVF